MTSTSTPSGLLEPVREHVVGIGDLADGEPGAQVLRQVIVVTRAHLRLHLQALDRLEPRDVLRGQRLVARAQQKLLVELGAEDGRDGEAERDDHRQPAPERSW